MGAFLDAARSRAQLFAAIALVATTVGCGHFRCGCSNGCGEGRQFALMKYDACCERCGDPAWGGPGCVAGSCGCNSCGPGAGGDCEGGCSSCGACHSRRGCGDCVECGDGCETCSECRIPIVGRFRGLIARCTHGGCNGCGELYWNEWYNDPPSCCVKCNCHGQYVGRGATSPHEAPLQSFGPPESSGEFAPPPLELAPTPTE